MELTVPSKTDLMYEILYNPKFVPLPSPKVNVKTTVVDGKHSYLMKNHATGIYYDLDELTNSIWNLTDGKRTVKQIIREIQRQNPKIQERTILEMLLFFADSNLLVSSLEPTRKKRFRVVSPFEVDFTIIEHSNDFVQSVYSKIRPIFQKFLFWVAIAFIIAGVVLFAGEFVSIYGKKANFEILGSSVVGFFFYYFVALAPVIVIHEMAHALTLVHYGGQAGEMGTGLFYFGPMFYTETTDAWGLSRRDRIMVYLSGNISTLLIGSSLVFVLLIGGIPEPVSHILLMIAFYCFNMSLFNFAPPFETDGYYMLSDIVNMPTLRRDSYSYLGSIIRRALGMHVKTKIPDLTKRKKRIFIVYAVLSMTWILYIVFQSSLFLVYMGQDVTAALANIVQASLSSQALQTSAVVIAVASTLYFGMQIVGYGFLFSAAVKKATVKPLMVEAIHDRDLAVFAYLPPQVPESLSNSLTTKMEKVAKKFTSNFEIKQVGRSCIAVLRMGGTSLALVQIKEHLKRVENEFSSVYQNLIKSNEEILWRSTGIYSPHKIKLENMFKQIAAESVDAGNSNASSIAKLCEEKQNEIFLCLLNSVFGTVWTIEVQPAQEYEIQKELVSSLLLEDLTLADLYNDTENFKKQVIYGFDSLAKLATEIDIGIRESLARPEEYQLVSVLEPIKSRIVLVGRTETIEENIHAFTPLFLVHTFSGYLDNLLSEACLKLSTLNRARLPSAREIKEMNIGELAVLTKDLSAFTENQKLVDECIQKSENHLTKIKQSLRQLKTTIKPSENFKIGLLDAIFHVNTENLDNLPNRIKEFRKEWKTLCKRIEKIREYVEKNYDGRKPEIVRKKSKMLRVYPLVVVLSIAFFILSFQSPLAAWWMIFLSIALISQVFYGAIFYRMWKSFHKVTKYPSQAFNMIQLFILGLTEAVYGYVATGDVLTPI
jgi:putative peptide zinc metalloprotease protein